MVASVGTRTLFPARVNLTLVAVLLLLAVTLPGGATAAPPSGAAGAMNGTTGTSGTSPAGSTTGGVINGVTNGSGVTTVGIDVTFLGLTITPTGTAATITFATSQPMRAGASYALAGGNGASAATPAGVVNATIIGQAVGRAAPPVRTTATDGFTGYAATVSTRHTIKLTGLQSNTLYTTNVWVTDGAGRQAQSRDLIFRTPKQRVRITYPSATVQESGQLIGDPDVVWSLDVGWAGGCTKAVCGAVLECYSYAALVISTGTPDPCQGIDTGTYDHGMDIPFQNTQGRAVGYLFREEDFDGTLPMSFTIAAQSIATSWLDSEGANLVVAIEGGGLQALLFATIQGGDLPPTFAPFFGNDAYVWAVPQGGESVTQMVSIRATDEGDFRSTVAVKLEVFYDEIGYASSTTVTDRIGSKTVVSLFT